MYCLFCAMCRVSARFFEWLAKLRYISPGCKYGTCILMSYIHHWDTYLLHVYVLVTCIIANIYFPSTKLREGNVFSRVCLPVILSTEGGGGGRVLYRTSAPLCKGRYPLNMFKLFQLEPHCIGSHPQVVSSCVVTACQRSCRKVMFSYMSVHHSVHVTITHDALELTRQAPRPLPWAPPQDMGPQGPPSCH